MGFPTFPEEDIGKLATALVKGTEHEMHHEMVLRDGIECH